MYEIKFPEFGALTNDSISIKVASNTRVSIYVVTGTSFKEA
jgi:hypothetical protein